MLLSRRLMVGADAPIYLIVDGYPTHKSRLVQTFVERQEAAVVGRVATLLIEADRQIPGRIDAATGRIEFDDLTHPEVDDLLDDLGELVLKMGGEVVLIPAERMPTQTGAAAIYRF